LMRTRTKNGRASKNSESANAMVVSDPKSRVKGSVPGAGLRLAGELRVLSQKLLG